MPMRPANVKISSVQGVNAVCVLLFLDSILPLMMAPVYVIVMQGHRVMAFRYAENVMGILLWTLTVRIAPIPPLMKLNSVLSALKAIYSIR